MTSDNSGNIRRLLVALCIALLVIGCKAQEKTSGSPDDKPATLHGADEVSRVKDTVLLYDALLAEGYSAQNMNALTQVATEQRAQKAYYHMAALGEGSVKMDSKLNEIIFSDIKIIGKDKAEAVTQEKWDYKYINYQSGRQVYDNAATYVMRYNLIKIAGKWLVDDLTVVSSQEKDPRQYEPVTGKSGK